MKKGRRETEKMDLNIVNIYNMSHITNKFNLYFFSMCLYLQYQKQYNDTVKSAAPPHIYAIADQAYFSMRRTGQDQCAVISGESGAGKTESAKYMIRHIIRLCHTGAEGAALEQKILQVRVRNPLPLSPLG